MPRYGEVLKLSNPLYIIKIELTTEIFLCIYIPIMRDEAVYGTILISKRGHVCIVQGRSTYKWSFPKGHCKDRETPFQCASRETREETGIQIPWQTHRPVKLSVGSYYVIFVETQFPSIVFDANEIVQVDWVSIEKLRVLRVNIDINSFLKKISSKSTDTVWSLIHRRCSGYGFTQRCQPCFQEEQCVV